MAAAKKASAAKRAAKKKPGKPSAKPAASKKKPAARKKSASKSSAPKAEQIPKEDRRPRLDLTAVAYALGVTTRQVQRYMSDDTDPLVAAVPGSGPRPALFDVKDLIAWVRRQVLRDVQIADGDEKIYIYEVEKGRLTYLQAEKEKRTIEKLDRELIPVDEITELLSRAFVEFRTHTLALPMRLAPLAVAGASVKETEKRCREEVEQYLFELEALIGEFVQPDPAGDGEAAQAAAATDSR